ncbi:MAG: hypothetical protein KDA63_10275, partial [Planctomycetales bacterium]|nr:hypothetical protein [Planctomycetales bacterium]
MSETIRRSARGGALRHEMRGRFRQLSGALLAVMLATPIALAAETATESAESAAAVANARILDATQYLASDDLEGRGVGTEGLNLAAQYIAARFAELGLDTELFDGTPFQQFEMTVGSELGATNEVELTGPPAAGSDTATTIPLELGEDFTPMSIGGSGKFDLPLAFVGYGITGSDEMYDDYEGIDVQGKAVIILRHEPQQDNPHSVFDGTETSRHAPFVRKLANAYEHGAAAVIFCTGEHEILKDVRRALARYENTLEELDQLRTKFAATEHPSLAAIDEYLDQVGDLVEQTQRRAERVRSVYDPMLGFHAAGAGSEAREMPVLFIRREPLSKVLKATLGK